MSGLDIAKYIAMKNEGSSAAKVFEVALVEDNLEFYGCVLILTKVFEITLDEARSISNEVIKELKQSNS